MRTLTLHEPYTLNTTHVMEGNGKPQKIHIPQDFGQALTWKNQILLDLEQGLPEHKENIFLYSVYSMTTLEIRYRSPIRRRRII